MAKVTITKDAQVEEQPELSVLSDSGSYNEEELITCYKTEDPAKEPYCFLEARYVKKGGEVYQ